MDHRVEADVETKKKTQKSYPKRSGPPGSGEIKKENYFKSHILNEVDHRVGVDVVETKKEDTKVISKRSGPPGRGGRRNKKKHQSHILNEVDHRVKRTSRKQKKKTQKSYPKRSGPPGKSKPKGHTKAVVILPSKTILKGGRRNQKNRHKSHILNEVDHRVEVDVVESKKGEKTRVEADVNRNHWLSEVDVVEPKKKKKHFCRKGLL